ncbi:cupin domain-containing protein [Herbiconiux ginsengi]|uniref:Cupin domain protein n=1 Tax=Herbiconiux ginsengi TaxID=381665 RepID=A0A1H3QLT9_9MICO|nr:cupin domain-containing protein [Herbiconiux ginsengi]SDZ14512.1 Cupin domain protein [Herbiconiux ginsengi]
MKHRPATVVALALAVVFAATVAGCAATPAASPASASSSADAMAPTPTPSAPATDTPVVVEELGKGEQDAAVDVEVAGPTQVAFRRITLHPGAGTGKHCHDGQLIAVVEQGTFTHYAPVYPGGVHVYHAGDSIVEGAHYVHEGKNEGTDDVVLLVTYVIPEGDPLAETDLSHCDPEQPAE